MASMPDPPLDMASLRAALAPPGGRPDPAVDYGRLLENTQDAMAAALHEAQANPEVQEDVEGLLEQWERINELHQQQQAARQAEPGLEVTPRPGFVAKTTDAEGAKVFVNICGSPKVEAPTGWQRGKVPDHIAAALEALEAGGGDLEPLRFPLAASAGRRDGDRQGAACTVYDVIFNSDLLATCAQHRKLKTFLVQLALTQISEKSGQQLSPDFKLPRLHYKGESILPQTLRLPKKELIQDMGPAVEEPTFALRSLQSRARRKQAKPAAAAAPAGEPPGEATAPPAQPQPSSAVPSPPAPAAQQDAAAGVSSQQAAAVGAASSSAPAGPTGPEEQPAGPPEAGPRALGDKASPEPGPAGRQKGLVGCQVAPQGMPVTGFEVTVTAAGATAEELQRSVIELEGSREALTIGVPGRPPHTLSLPLAVGATGEEGAAARVECSATVGPVLVLWLPYRPVTSCHQEALQQQRAPAFGGLKLSAQSALSIED